MSARDAEIDAFLAAAGWGGAVRTRLAGDASTRTYERVSHNGRIAMVMNQPLNAETAPCPPDATPAERMALGYNAAARLAAGRVDAFTAAARHLTGLGLSAPAIYAADAPNGLALIEDLGDGLYARLIEQGADEAMLYDAAIDALAALQAAPAPATLPGGWPLLTYDDLALKVAHEIIIEWLPQFRPGLVFDSAAIADWDAIWTPIRARGVAMLKRMNPSPPSPKVAP